MVEFETALISLTNEKVDFVIGGGLAISAHSTGYITTDLDFCYLRKKENLKKSLQRSRLSNHAFEITPKIYRSFGTSELCRMERILRL